MYDSHDWHFSLQLEKCPPHRTQEVAAATCGVAAAAKENGNQVPVQLRIALELQELSSDQNPGYFLYLGDHMLPSYKGITISCEIRIPSWTNQYFMECHVRVLCNGAQLLLLDRIFCRTCHSRLTQTGKPTWMKFFGDKKINTKSKVWNVWNLPKLKKWNLLKMDGT